MSTLDDVKSEHATPKIIRLKVEGANSTVNTLSDQQTTRGVSLICPFPALEVNLPASFGSAEEGAMKNGTIHRIGVEDDPETGLPRLRLSIRSEDTRSTVIEQPSVSLIDVASRHTESEKPSVEENPEDIEEEEYSFDISCDAEDPEWVNCDEIPLPEEFLARAKTRRRYKMVRKAVYLALLLIIAAGGFVLERTGTISLDDVRSYVAGLSINTKDSKKGASTQSLEALSNQTEIVPEMIQNEVDQEEALRSEMDQGDLSPDMTLTEQDEGSQAEEMEEAVSPVQLASAKLEGKNDPPEETDVAAEFEEEVEENSGANEDSVTILLPTRWPVEYASGYRVRNPNGVVIDVPGGLVKKEGWIEEASEHPMIKSVKSIQRETGARFVVYVNGRLPRFMTSPKGNGVALRLYELKGSDLSTQEVAMAD